jgi:hypothetical protein
VYGNSKSPINPRDFSGSRLAFLKRERAEVRGLQSGFDRWVHEQIANLETVISKHAFLIAIS